MSRADDWLFGRWGPVEKQVINWAKDVLWPEGALCCACGRASGGEALCPACRESLLYDGSVFAWVRNDPEPGLPAWSLRAHEGVARQLVLRLKYGAEARAARLLSEILLPLPEDVSFPPDTVVTWVTMPESLTMAACWRKTSRKSWACPAAGCCCGGTAGNAAR